MDLHVDGQRLQHDADEGEGDGQGHQGYGLHALLDDVEQGNDPDAPVSLGTDRVPGNELRPRQHGLVEQPAAGDVSDPVLDLPPSAATALRARTTRSSGAAARRVLAAPLLAGRVDDDGWCRRRRLELDRDYLGYENVTVPAFPAPVKAAKVRTEITQAGALGDPYGSGVRTVWWVYGVGPVKIVFEHAGSGSPITTVGPTEHELGPEGAPADTRWFPLDKGTTSTFRWTNSKHMKKPSVEELRRMRC